MSGIELNKIVASILLASLIAMVVGVVANVLYKPVLKVAKRGYEVPVTATAEAGGEAVKAEPINIEALMAKANAANGANVMKKCASCHNIGKGEPAKVGPNLWDIVGAKRGKQEGYAYSKVLSEADGVWDNDHLFGLLISPAKYMPGTKMSFAGLKNPQDIADVIAFLKENAAK